MKTANFLKELSRFGWEQDRKKKHIMLTNRLFTPDRPLALRKQDEKDIDPIAVSIQAKHAGLVWDSGRQALRLNPDHPYFKRYQQALGARAA